MNQNTLKILVFSKTPFVYNFELFDNKSANIDFPHTPIRSGLIMQISLSLDGLIPNGIADNDDNNKTTESIILYGLPNERIIIVFLYNKVKINATKHITKDNVINV